MEKDKRGVTNESRFWLGALTLISHLGGARNDGSQGGKRISKGRQGASGGRSGTKEGKRETRNHPPDAGTVGAVSGWLAGRKGYGGGRNKKEKRRGVGGRERVAEKSVGAPPALGRRATGRDHVRASRGELCRWGRRGSRANESAWWGVASRQVFCDFSFPFLCASSSLMPPLALSPSFLRASAPHN